MSTNELKHYGVLGMKWGVRRYQNKNGSLTEAGRRRYEKNLKNVNKIKNSSSSLIQKGREIEERTRPKAERKKIDLSNMTDDELRNKINRYELEKRYNDLFAPKEMPKISKGRRAAQILLKYGDEAIVIGTSAISLAVAIKALKEK